MRANEIPYFDILSDRERAAMADDILSSLKNPDALSSPLEGL